MARPARHPLTIIPFPEHGSHVGQVVRQHFLDPSGLTAADLADLADLPQEMVDRLLAGRQRVTPMLARALERAFDASAAFWLALQAGLDIRPPATR